MTGHGYVKALEEQQNDAKSEIKYIEIQYSNGEDFIGCPSQADIVGIIENLLNYLQISKISEVHFKTAGRLIEAQNQSSATVIVCPDCLEKLNSDNICPKCKGKFDGTPLDKKLEEVV